MSRYHLNMERAVGFEGLFTIFTVTVQAPYTYLEAPAAILILGRERGHIYISLFIVVFFTSGIVFYFWSFIATEEREVVDCNSFETVLKDILWD